jgi:hypothetical protein
LELGLCALKRISALLVHNVGQLYTGRLIIAVKSGSSALLRNVNEALQYETQFG